MAESIALNCDCMEYMRSLPDKAFDLAVVDPPYGGGFTEGGGCKGWFTRYRQDVIEPAAERERERESWNRFGQRFDRYKQTVDNGTGNRSTTEKAKKLFRGT